MTDIKLPPLPDIDRWFPASWAGFAGMMRCADDKPEHVDEYVDINDHIEAMQAYAREAVRMNACESRASTHAEGCWSWGPAHYECAVREIERLRKMHQDAYQQGLEAGFRIQAVKRQDDARLARAALAQGDEQ